MLVHIKELQLLISCNNLSFIYPVHFLIFILCLELCFQFSFLFLAAWKAKHYHVWQLLHSQMVWVCMCTVNRMDFWKCQPNNMHTCIPSFAFLPFRRAEELTGSWNLECVLLPSDSCNLLGDSLFPVHCPGSERRGCRLNELFWWLQLFSDRWFSSMLCAVHNFLFWAPSWTKLASAHCH